MNNSPPGPKTVEQACALPEFTGSIFDPKVKIGFASIDGDDIVLFVDRDGVTKQPVFVDGKWMKQRSFL